MGTREQIAIAVGCILGMVAFFLIVSLMHEIVLMWDRVGKLEEKVKEIDRVHNSDRTSDEKE